MNVSEVWKKSPDAAAESVADADSVAGVSVDAGFAADACATTSSGACALLSPGHALWRPSVQGLLWVPGHALLQLQVQPLL